MLRSQTGNSPGASSEGSGEVDRPRWVCVELSSNGEKEKNIAAIIRAVRQILGRSDIEVFVPAISEKVRNESHTMVYMDGYVFVRYEEKVPYMRLQDTTFFKSVLCTTVVESGQRKHRYSLLDDAAIEPMREGVQSLRLGQSQFSVGQLVKVVKGDYKNLPGEISEVYDSKLVQISIRLRSKLILMDFPVSFLVRIQ